MINPDRQRESERERLDFPLEEPRFSHAHFDSSSMGLPLSGPPPSPPCLLFFSRGLNAREVRQRRRGRSPMAWRGLQPRTTAPLATGQSLCQGFDIPADMDIFGFAAKRQAPVFSFFASATSSRRGIPSHRYASPGWLMMFTRGFHSDRPRVLVLPLDRHRPRRRTIRGLVDHRASTRESSCT